MIVVGPRLKLHQCGLPKAIVLELFQPFIIRALKERGYAETVKAAKRKLERRDEEVWEVLDDVIKGKVVMLNRAPTLHRMGIQAFEVTMIEGSAIQIHPLVCAGFNADFDGDQMAVHLPLSIEAQTEARILMLSTNNIFSPASGSPIISADQDIVLGCYFLTLELDQQPGEGKVFADEDEVRLALDAGVVSLHSKIKYLLPAGKLLADGGVTRKQFEQPTLIETTVGRVLFNIELPEGMPFYNYTHIKKTLGGVINDTFGLLGRQGTIDTLDAIKNVGFRYSTRSGLSMAMSDLSFPPEREKLVTAADKKATRFLKNYRMGAISATERHRNVRDVWTHCTNAVGKALMKHLSEGRPEDPNYINPVYAMAHSRARGSEAQVRQLAGMRGLMAKPNGEIIETPIRASFKDGLRVLEYFTSTHGARKGLADTALKTADSGYLTRKLVDVAQDVIISEYDCGTTGGLTKGVVYEGETVKLSLAEAILGRIARDRIVDVATDEVICEENQMITGEIAAKIEGLGYDKIRVRSPLTCDSLNGICRLCYGMDHSRGLMVEPGVAVGVIAAQSIGEPGTQLTMRTFHIGGVAGTRTEDTSFKARRAGIATYDNLRTVVNPEGKTVVLNRNGELDLADENGKVYDRLRIPAGATLHVADGGEITQGMLLADWDGSNIPILCDVAGTVRFEDIILDVTMAEERDKATGIVNRVILEGKGAHHPHILLVDDDGTVVSKYPVPEKATLRVNEGDKLEAGSLLASTPRKATGPTDITGGLPRVTELFEARPPKDPAVMAEIDGEVDFGDRKRGKRTIIVRGESGSEAEHIIPQGKHFRVHKGDRVKAGEPLVDGTLVPKDLLRICGEEALQDYLLGEIQSVYRAQNVGIDDKHIEVIIRQMLRKVDVTDSGELGNYLAGTIADKVRLREDNLKALSEGKQPATFEPKLMGITRAALQSESFISAASFQETTKVLADAALAGKRDELRGLKENVILGHLVPCGTGFTDYRHGRINKHGVPVVPQEDPAMNPAPLEEVPSADD